MTRGIGDVLRNRVPLFLSSVYVIYPLMIVRTSYLTISHHSLTDALQVGASQFETNAGKLKRKYWWKNCKMMIILGVIVAVILIIIVGKDTCVYRRPKCCQLRS